MPRAPATSRISSGVRASTFGAVQDRMRRSGAARDLIPLHIGDTHLMPSEVVRRLDLDRQPLYRLGPPEGDPCLRRATEHRLQAGHGFDMAGRQVLITPGGTGGVSLAVEAVFDPGDEVLVITPTWPIVFGALERRGVEIREVSIGAGAWPEPEPAAFRERLRRALGPRTAGIYLCDPNNPSGFVTPRSFLAELAEVAVSEDLWLLYDLAYLETVFEDAVFAPLAAEARLANRCLAIGSFTKSFALAGLRVGYVVVPESICDLLVRLQTHTTLHTSTASQAMALACLEGGDDGTISRSYQRAATIVRQGLEYEMRPPQAGAFVFLDLRPLGILTANDTDRFLEDCLEQGVALCPGSVFGEGFEPFVRLCFSCVPEESLREAIRRINRVVGAWRVERAKR